MTSELPTKAGLWSTVLTAYDVSLMCRLSQPSVFYVSLHSMTGHEFPSLTPLWCLAVLEVEERICYDDDLRVFLSCRLEILG